MRIVDISEMKDIELRAQKEFGFDETKDYGQIRIYAFLAERFLCYWFKKISNFIVWRIIHFEI